MFKQGDLVKLLPQSIYNQKTNAYTERYKNHIYVVTCLTPNLKGEYALRPMQQTDDYYQQFFELMDFRPLELVRATPEEAAPFKDVIREGCYVKIDFSHEYYLLQYMEPHIRPALNLFYHSQVFYVSKVSGSNQANLFVHVYALNLIRDYSIKKIILEQPHPVEALTLISKENALFLDKLPTMDEL